MVLTANNGSKWAQAVHRINGRISGSQTHKVITVSEVNDDDNSNNNEVPNSNQILNRNEVLQLQANAQNQEFSFAEFDDKRRIRHNAALSINTVLIQFCQETSTHGPANIYRIQSVIGKMVWGMVFCAALAGVVIHMGLLVSKYQAWPVQEMTSLSHEPVSFPDVTVCNLRKISDTNLAQLLANKSSKAYQYKKLLREWPAASKVDWIKLRSRADIGLFENIGSEEASRISHSQKDFFVYCMFKGIACTDERIEKYVNSFFYNCYTFKGKSAAEELMVAGPAYGLIMEFYLETYNGSIDGKYLKTFSVLGNTVGVRVMIHPPGTMPIPYSQGFEIMPGHSTSVALNVHQIQRLSEPYGKCTSNETLRDLPNYQYSLAACSKMCMQRHCMETCGCQTSYHPLPSSSQHEEYCGKLNTTPEKYLSTTLCEFQAWTAFNNDSSIREACNCLMQCESFTYTPIITESYWPDPSSFLSFYDYKISSRPDRSSLKAFQQLNHVLHDASVQEKDKLDIVRLNFARLSIFFKDVEVFKREQVPSYGLNDLFSDFGGSMGLWVGISILSIVETIQFFMMLVVVCIIRIRAARLAKKTTTNKKDSSAK